jgi:hypothetical protein
LSQIRNLVICGCSYTDDKNYRTWASILSRQYPNINYHNIAASGAGNDYICNRTINFLEQQSFDPAETLIMVMWSGTGRKDLKVSGEWWYHIQDQYPWARRDNHENYYVFSGGLTNSWTTNNTTKKIFNWLYRVADPLLLCQDSLMNFLNLENYLKVKGYKYRFTSFANYWDTESESNFLSGDYNIGFFCQNDPLYQKFNFSNLFFIDHQKNCLAEFSRDISELDKTGHPTKLSHQQFVDQIVLPEVSNLFD